MVGGRNRSLNSMEEVMTINNPSEAAKAVVRRNTEEVQGGGNFDVLTNSSPMIFSTTRRSPAAHPTRRALGICIGRYGLPFPTFTPKSIGRSPMATA